METVEVEKILEDTKDATDKVEELDEAGMRVFLGIYRNSLRRVAEERDSLRESADYWRKQSSVWESDNDQLRREVKTIRAHQAESDAAAVEAARKEAEEAMWAELDEARKALYHVKAEAQALRAQVEWREASAASRDLPMFQLLLEQVREMADWMREMLKWARVKTPPTAKEMARDLLEFGDFVRRIAEDGTEGGEPG